MYAGASLKIPGYSIGRKMVSEGVMQEFSRIVECIIEREFEEGAYEGKDLK